VETINQVLKMNSESKESDCRTCPKCGDPIERVTYLPGFNRYIKGPVVCSCKKVSIESKEIEEQNREKQLRLKQIIKNSLMDSKFKQCRFENWDHKRGTEKIFNIGTKYAANFPKMKKEGIGLLIYGPPGNGKTYASSCIANELMDNLTPVICISINGLLDRIKQTFNTWGKEGEETILRSLSNADLLIIDDLGTEQDKDWHKTTVYNILDSRYRNGLPLIVTTNFPLEELKEKYHERTYDRLTEMCTPIKNEGKSIRVEKAKEKTSLLSELLKGD
jgi:DNA replication protein DnaC